MGDSIRGIPATRANWLDQSEIHGVRNRSIFGLVAYNSGSNMDAPQYLALRILWRANMNTRDFVRKLKSSPLFLTKDSYTKALNNLGNRPSWIEYEKSYMRKGERWPFGECGPFTLVRLHQLATAKTKPSAKVSQKVFHTPMKLRSTRIMPNSSESPTPKRGTRVTQYELGTPSEPDDLDSLTIDGLNLSDTSSFASPTSPGSVWAEEYQEPTEDEQVVNTALIDFLMAVTVKDMRRLEWSLFRRGFRLGEDTKVGYVARVDGVLRRRNVTQDSIDLGALAIIEVKPFIRSINEDKIRLQEGSQMAAWIASDKALEGTVPGKVKSRQKLE